MLYKINGEYYMLRNREYIKVDIKLEDNNLIIKPDRTNVIEDNGNIKAKGVLIDTIGEELKKSKQSLDTFERKNKYDR